MKKNENNTKIEGREPKVVACVISNGAVAGGKL